VNQLTSFPRVNSVRCRTPDRRAARSGLTQVVPHFTTLVPFTTSSTGVVTVCGAFMLNWRLPILGLAERASPYPLSVPRS
jgi:hypothetical protein